MINNILIMLTKMYNFSIYTPHHSVRNWMIGEFITFLELKVCFFLDYRQYIMGEQNKFFCASRNCSLKLASQGIQLNFMTGMCTHLYVPYLGRKVREGLRF